MARIFIPPERIADTLQLQSREIRYLVRVLRLEPGDEVVVFDGEGKQYRAGLFEEGGRWWLELRERLPAVAEPPVRIVLGQGLLKGEKMKWVIQKATELGVSEIVPLLTARSIPLYEGEEASLKAKRWRRIAEEASRQCNRATVPEVAEPMDLTGFVQRTGGMKVALWEGATRSLREIEDEGTPREIALVVGPEGGLSEEEAAFLEGEGFTLVSLGPRVLRAETAALAVLSLMGHIFGDLG